MMVMFVVTYDEITDMDLVNIQIYAYIFKILFSYSHSCVNTHSNS